MEFSLRTLIHFSFFNILKVFIQNDSKEMFMLFFFVRQREGELKFLGEIMLLSSADILRKDLERMPPPA